MKIKKIVTVLGMFNFFTISAIADTVTFDDVNGEPYTIEFSEFADTDSVLFEIIGMKAGGMDSQESLSPLYVSDDAGISAANIFCSYVNSDWESFAYGATMPDDSESMGYDFFAETGSGDVTVSYMEATNLSYYSQSEGFVVMKYVSCE